MADGINLDYYLAQLYKIQEHREQKAEKDIRKISKQLMQELTAFVGTEYQKYAEDDKLSYEILNKHAEYAKFVSEVNKRLNTSTQKAFKIAKALCDETYAKCFEGFSNAVQRAVEGNKNLSEILHTTTRSASQRAIKRAVENPVSGLTLTDNLEKNRKEIVYKINQEIGIGLANGSSYTNMAKRISEAVDGNYKKSMLITRTETHRVKEAGYNDAAKEVDDVLRDDESDFRMVKVWRTAQDDAVRKTNKANHKDMQGVVVLQDEEFDLGHGVKTLVPGSSGSAANDCNCRCRVSRKIMSDAEFFKATGRHFPNHVIKGNTIKAYKDEYAKLDDEEKTLQKEKDELKDLKIEKRIHDAERREYWEIENKLKEREELQRFRAETDIDAVKAELEAVTAKQDEVSKIVNKFYDRPDRKTEPEKYAEWREWKSNTDVQGAIEEQLKLSEEIVNLQSTIRKYEREIDIDFDSDKYAEYLEWKKFDEKAVDEKIKTLEEKLNKKTAEIVEKRSNVVQKAGKETVTKVKEKQAAINVEYDEKLVELKHKKEEAAAEIEKTKQLRDDAIDKRYMAEAYADHYASFIESDEWKTLKAAEDEYEKLYDRAWDKLNDIGLQEQALKNERARKQATAIREHIASIRKVGTDKDLDEYLIPAKPRSINDKAMQKIVKEAMQNYPSEWIEASNGIGKLTIGKVDRGYYSHTRSELMISGNADERSLATAFHELGHRLERAVPHALELEKAFYERRTKGEELKTLREITGNDAFRKDEVSRKDNFINPYMGKDYGGDAYELISMGFEYAMTNPEILMQDLDYAEFILGILTLS